MCVKRNGTNLVNLQMDQLKERIKEERLHNLDLATEARSTFSEMEDFYDGKISALDWVLEEIKDIMTDKKGSD